MADDKQDKNFVVVVDGKRASGLLTESDAQQEAERKRKAEESGEQPKVEVKQNLFG